MEGKIIVGVAAIVLRAGKILLGKRAGEFNESKNKLLGVGTWSLPGGKVDPEESLDKACAREIFEETGLVVKESNLKFVSTRDEREGDLKVIVSGFFCEKFDGEFQNKEPHKICDWQWFDLNKLPKPLFYLSEQVIKDFLKNKKDL